MTVSSNVSSSNVSSSNVSPSLATNRPVPRFALQARFALQDCRTGELYPLPHVQTWLETYIAASDAANGKDVGLLVPPPPGASLRPVSYAAKAQKAAGAAEQEKIAEQRQQRAMARREKVDAEILAIYGDWSGRFGNPKATDGNPKATDGNPKATDGNPKATDGNPETTNGNSHRPYGKNRRTGPAASAGFWESSAAWLRGYCLFFLLIAAGVWGLAVLVGLTGQPLDTSGLNTSWLNGAGQSGKQVAK